VELIQGEGGFIVPPPEFHKELKRICRENDVLLIADEIQSGGYRAGKFMAREIFEVRADNRVHVQVHSAEEYRLVPFFPAAR
jgi:4-aminobutyrate aminotransferase